MDLKGRLGRLGRGVFKKILKKDWEGFRGEGGLKEC